MTPPTRLRGNATKPARFLPLALLGAALFAAGCGGGTPSRDPGWAPRDTTAGAPWAVGCSEDHVPIVMVHGFLASGDTWANHTMRFAMNGYCEDRVFAYDWNSVDGESDPALLDAFIDGVLATTGATSVDLVGHSAGGGIGYDYLSDATRAAKVRRYVHVGSSSEDAPAGPAGGPSVPTLNLYSSNDRVIAGAVDIPGATNVDLDPADHYEVATNAASFSAIWAFLTDETAPPLTDLSAPTTSDDPPVIAGRALGLGTNSANPGARIRVFAVDEATGQRRGGVWARGEADENGYWGPFEVEPGVRYELEVTPQDENPDDDMEPRIIHYYREAFSRTNTKVYLRTIPPPTSLLTRILIGSLRIEDDQPTQVVFIANRGLVPGDTLSVDALDLSGDDFTARDNTTIALFLYDADEDGMSGGTPIALFGTLPFLAGADYAPGADSSATTSITLNDVTIAIPRWPAASEGVGIAVFD